MLVFINLAWKRRPVDELLAYRIVKTAEIKFIEIVRVLECKLVEIIKHSPRYTYALVCVIICALILKYIEKRYDINSFINKPSSSFIEENYIVPKIEFKEKKNLILIFLESMEHGYSSAKIFEENLIPDLQRIAQKNITFFGHQETYGSHWTQAAHVNMLMGIPLLYIGNKGTSNPKFLPGAVAITDILKQNGYKIFSLFGASGKFADMGKLFLSHGVPNVWEKDYFDLMGCGTPENRGTAWGYKDAFIYDKMLDLYKKLKDSNEPFCLIMRTVDTHFPYGFADEKYRKFGDVRDSILEANRMCVDFIKKVKNIGLENTTIVLVGDHLWMDTPGIEFTDIMMPNLRYRHIYNAFINSSKIPEIKNKVRNFAAFDMAPTILESIGAQLDGRSFALGRSLFSRQENLVERYGVEYINEEFKKHSTFYGKLVNGDMD